MRTNTIWIALAATTLLSACTEVVGDEASCGDNKRDPGEACDGTDLANQSCRDFGFQRGALRCTSACVVDTGDCVAPGDEDNNGAQDAIPVCGNGIVETGEECDSSVGDKTCERLGFDRGELRCDTECLWDRSRCAYDDDTGPGICGDGTCQPDESSRDCCEDCGCGQGQICGADGCVTEDQGPECGDSICEGDETNRNCCADCACADGDICDGERCVAAPDDCNEGEIISQGSWSACLGFSDACDESGTQTRVVVLCRNGEAQETQDEQACTRRTEGEVQSRGQWGQCGGFDNACDETGEEARTNRVCRNGRETTETETQSCTRRTQGELISEGRWGTCSGFSDDCDETGQQTRANRVCNNGREVTDNEERSCSRDTDGDEISPGQWGTCSGFDDDCDTRGTRTRTPRVCQGGRETNGRAQSESCTRHVEEITEAEPNPRIRSWTSEGPCDTQRSRALYVGTATSIRGNRANLEFRKCGGGGLPSQTLRTWVVVGVRSPSDGTVCRDSSCTRYEGTWSRNDDDYNVSNIPIWPTESAFDAADCGEVKNLYLVTDGRGVEGQRTWYQYQAIQFEKMCECRP